MLLMDLMPAVCGPSEEEEFLNVKLSRLILPIVKKMSPVMRPTNVIRISTRTLCNQWININPMMSCCKTGHLNTTAGALLTRADVLKTRNYVRCS